MPVIFEPGTSPVASRHPNHWAMTNGLNFLNLFSSNLLLKETVSYHNIATCLMQVMFVNHDTCYKDKIWKFIGLFYDCYSPSTELLRILWRNDCLTPIHHYWARSERHEGFIQPWPLAMMHVIPPSPFGIQRWSRLPKNEARALCQRHN